MNNICQYTFDLLHVLVNARDTLEFVLPQEPNIDAYNRRKEVLKKGLDEETPLGRFLKGNEEQENIKHLVEVYHNLLDEVYGDDSKIIVKGNDGKLRVDHTQNIRIFELVSELCEGIKDIVLFHVNIARNNKEYEDVLKNVIDIDDNYYRIFVALLVIQEFRKSFFEFQKIMGESQGKQTPQATYIVNNELSVMAKILRDLRARARFTDNKTLDALDKVIQLVEMTEGRRDRRDNRDFPNLFEEVINNLNDLLVKDFAPLWNEKFNKAFSAMIETIRAKAEEAKASGEKASDTKAVEEKKE